MQILSKFFSKAIIIIATLIAFIGLNANLFQSNHYPHLLGIYSWLIFGFALVIISLALVFYRHLTKYSTKTLLSLLIISYLSMLIAQIIISHLFTVSLVRDPFRVTSTAMQLATSFSNHFTWPIYFSRALNNINITLLLSQLLSFSHWLPFSLLTQVKLWQLFLVQLVVLVTLLNIYLATNNLRLVLLMQLWFTFSPFLYTYNLLVFYTDTWLILGFGVLLLGLQLLFKYPLKRWQKLIVSIITILAAFISELIKPNFIIVIPALIIWLTILSSAKQLKKSLLLAIIGIISMTLLAFPTNNVINKAVGFHADSRYEFPVQHWIMMGLNQKSEGAYDNQDVKLTSRPSTLQAKKQQDTQIIKQRLTKLGLTGYFNLIIAKLQNLQNQEKLNQSYIDGYSKAPNWFLNNPNQINVFVTIFTKLGMSIIFILVIIGLLSVFTKAIPKIALLASLVYIGLLLFHAFLWESNNRYGEAIIIPLFFLATLGFQKLALLTKKYKFRHLPKFMALASLGIVILGWLNFKPLMVNADYKTTHPFYGQFSNWGGNFDYPAYQLAPKKTLHQDIFLPTSARMLVVRTIAQQKGIISLKYQHQTIFRQSNFNKLPTEMNGDSGIRIKHRFKAGCYALKYQNPTNHVIKVRLQAAPYALHNPPIDNLNGHKSFIFMFRK
ncbi:hypothetical protein JOC59_000439 [Weissella beninensis]|uniref:Glycosyltransferase RgtA/B/C/D-like domain-containing protein n=1 Tax=Periweissella beninensis TaxID=504936 RepID=A0ABT0VHV0_9LACO|nr:hypothetical protein [Periweissella beninensis]MBM7543739.1 hypothetical protein [Periweissella beninensis]MCM2436718.1 hypothetical protein [Periweissella beninensis]